VPSARILMGVVGRPHGVRGLVRVHSYTADAADLAGYGPLVDDKGRTWTLAWKGADGVAELRDAAGKPLPDRTAAQALTNLRLYVDRERLPPADPDEFYLADLVGLRALATDGTTLGQVALVHDYGAGASLEIARDGAAPLIVPFTRAAVPAVDIAAGCLTIDPPTEIAGEAQAA
jgi:16S rRNA processing protein RimM